MDETISEGFRVDPTDTSILVIITTEPKGRESLHLPTGTQQHEVIRPQYRVCPLGQTLSIPTPRALSGKYSFCTFNIDLIPFFLVLKFFNLCEETISTDEGQPRPKYIFNKCGTNIYFLLYRGLVHHHHRILK